MTLRRRLTLLAAGSVALALCLAAVVVYVAVHGALRGQVDDSLRAQAPRIAEVVPDSQTGSLPNNVLVPPPGAPEAFGPAPLYVQAVAPDGTASQPPQFGAPLPIDGAARSIAGSGQGSALSDAQVDGVHVRVLTTGVGTRGAVQVARSLTGTDDVLANLRVVLFLVIGGGIALAALLARRIADRMIAPITGLTEAAERISETEDLALRIEAAGDDEVGRLAGRFNSMLATLESSRAELADSVQAQRQLVADASHELRTPVASLRTDIEVMRENPALADAERSRMLAGIDRRLSELGALITDVIELARGDEAEGAVSEVRLDLLAAEAVERMRGHASSRRFELSLAESVVEARPDRLARAINNLLDNAVKYSPPDQPIEVGVAGGQVVVRDHGPGVEAGELAKVFDRFHRGAGVREVPGSGLGLAIVKQVAEAHGGTVSAANAPGGGAVFTLRLPEE
jgi:two-component system, OmpR family, sensor histidine kinase MprB